MNGSDDTRNPDPDAPGDVGRTLEGNFEVRAAFEGGGMAVVHHLRHHDGTDAMDVVAKRARPEFSERFEDEVVAWLGLPAHPNVVTALAARRIEGAPCLLAEYVGGGTLDQWISRGTLYEGGPQRALQRLLDVAIQTTAGLHHAHRRDLVHQDVKPSNVLLTEAAEAKLSDFGLVRKRKRPGRFSSPLADASHAQALTMAYASPEQCAGQSLDPTTDLFSLGVILVEMLVGGRSWQYGPAIGEVLAGLLEDWPIAAPVARPPAALTALLEQCFQEDRSQRPRSAAEVVRRLADIHEPLAGARHPRADVETDRSDQRAWNDRAVALHRLGVEERTQRFQINRGPYEILADVDWSATDAFYPALNLALLQIARGLEDPLQALIRLGPRSEPIAARDPAVRDVVARLASAAWQAVDGPAPMLPLLAALGMDAFRHEHGEVRLSGSGRTFLGQNERLGHAAVDDAGLLAIVEVAATPAPAQVFVVDLRTGDRTLVPGGAPPLAAAAEGLWACRVGDRVRVGLRAHTVREFPFEVAQRDTARICLSSDGLHLCVASTRTEGLFAKNVHTTEPGSLSVHRIGDGALLQQRAPREWIHPCRAGRIFLCELTKQAARAKWFDFHGTSHVGWTAMLLGPSGREDFPRVPTHFSLARDGLTFAVWEGSTVHVGDATTGRLTSKLVADAQVNAVEFSADGHAVWVEELRFLRRSLIRRSLLAPFRLCRQP